MRLWGNLVGYQLVWFAAVMGAGRGWAWAGVVAFVLFAATQWPVATRRRLTLQVMLAAVGCGVLLDGALAASGWAMYAAPWPSTSLAPVWILAMWAAFALTLDVSLAWLQRHRAVAAVIGAVGGPLAYLGAGRGFDAITFVQPVPALVLLAVGWGIALPLLLSLLRPAAVADAPAVAS